MENKMTKIKNKLTEIVGITLIGLTSLTGSFMLGRDKGIDEGRQEVMNAIGSYYLDRLSPEELSEEAKEEAYKGQRILLNLNNDANRKVYPERYTNFGK